MTRIAPPLLGYNNNVRYLGRTFHIQTEDSGIKYARIMTHLFMDGGRIVKTTKTDYGAMVGQPDMAETVRRMMKEQHKNMFLSLRAGEFDQIIERVLNNAEAPASSIAPTLSQVPRLRADSLPSLSFTNSEEPKTIPGLPSLLDTSSLASPEPQSTRAAAPLSLSERVQEQRSSEQRSSEQRSSEPFIARESDSTADANGAAKHPSARPRKSKSVVPSSPRRQRLVDDPTPADLPETAMKPVTNRPSERPSRSVAVRPPTLIQEAIDPRTQSIFGEAAVGRQTLDEVILSFLEDEES